MVVREAMFIVSASDVLTRQSVPAILPRSSISALGLVDETWSPKDVVRSNLDTIESG
jgi:hypothetical protein